MNDLIDNVQVRVTEDDPKALTITVRNKPNGGCNNVATSNAPVAKPPQVPEPPPSEPPRKPGRKRDSNQYRDTGQWRDLVVQEWEAVASGESLGGMTLGEFKAATEPVVAERANLKRLRGDVSGAIARRNTADQVAKKIINRVIAGVKASPNFGLDSDLYRQLGYVPDIERQRPRKRGNIGDGESPGQ